MDRFVRIKSLCKDYYGRGLLKRKRGVLRAVDRVNFGIDRNSVFGLVGESGCGKTSLARAVLYLDPPTEGEVWIDRILLGDLSPSDLRAFRKRMQIVFQDPNSALNPKMRIADSLAEGLVNLRVPAGERARRIRRMLDLVGIAHAHRKRFPHEFSGGQKQRLVVARALTMAPDFLILDEPVSNLDVSIQAQIINLLLDLKSELKLTYLFISHDLNLVGYLSDEIGVMYQGRLVELGQSDHIMATPYHPYTRRLFSSVPGRQPLDQPSYEESVERTAVSKPPPPQSGCPYLGECPDAMGGCEDSAPELRHVSPEHLVACRLPTVRQTITPTSHQETIDNERSKT